MSEAEFFRSGPKPKPVLDRVHEFLQRFVSYPSEHTHVAHSLWIAHAHLMDAWDSTPRIAFISPEPGSGKTRALEVTELLVPRPVEAVNVTPAYLFRKVDDPDGRPTVLFDEIDTVFGPKAKENEELRGLLNAGHRRGAVAGRCVVKGKTVVTEEIPAYCAVALAGLGGLPDTLLSRSVIVKMRRRAPDETIEPFRRRDQEKEGYALRDELARWAYSVERKLAKARPEMPEGIEDRNADVWEALIAVADEMGADWPERARVAAVALVADSKADTPSLGIRLLSDLRTVFGAAEVLSSETILAGLIGLEESPWGDLRGRPLNARGLAYRLRDYGVRSKTIRIGETTPRGYAKEDFHDAWIRYLDPLTKSIDSCVNLPPRGEGEEAESMTQPPLAAPPHESATSATNETNGATHEPYFQDDGFTPCCAAHIPELIEAMP